MNIRTAKSPKRRRGFTLIEMLVYMAIFTIVVGFAVTTFLDFWGNTSSLRRNADNVARTLEIGERWRADVRRATGAVQVNTENGIEQCRIPAASGAIIYTSANGEIHRQAGPAAPNTLWLAGVKTSQMQSDVRGNIAAWRWELELKSERREPRLRPLFTFESVPLTATAQ